MCQQHITVPFKFHCYTDVVDGIYDDINIIPYVEFYIDHPVFNKLYMFSEQFDAKLDSNPRVFFDLDIAIRKNIDHIVNINAGDLTVIKAQWRAQTTDTIFPVFAHQLNSSCMTWKSPNTRLIWNKFEKNMDYYMSKYMHGMDCFINYEIGNIKTFPLGNFYSHLYGIDYQLNEKDLKDPSNVSGIYRRSTHADLANTYPVVLLNGPTTDADYAIYFS